MSIISFRLFNPTVSIIIQSGQGVCKMLVTTNKPHEALGQELIKPVRMFGICWS